jgi:hypothetical protein
MMAMMMVRTATIFVSHVETFLFIPVERFIILTQIMATFRAQMPFNQLKNINERCI